jgi:uncharacterized Tic20 family protein
MEHEEHESAAPTPAVADEQAIATATEPGTAKKADHTMGMLCHLVALTMLLGVPMGHLLGPLVIWLIKRQEDPFVDACGKESLNFQISMTIYFAISFLLAFIVIGFFMMIGVMILNITLTIIAAIKASEGTSYTYPCTIRFIK